MTMGGALAEAVRAAVAAERARREAAEAECARLRVELAAVRSAVRMLDGARAAIDANGQRVLRSIAGEERAALLEELAVARRERDDWNARATAMEAERDEARAAVAAERARCAAVCREVAAQHWATGVGGAAECADTIERGEAGR
jgi:chromosome segregation ATPase